MKKILSLIAALLIGSLLLYQAGLKHGYSKGIEKAQEARRRASEAFTLYGQNKTRGTLPQRIAEGVTDSIADIITIWD